MGLTVLDLPQGRASHLLTLLFKSLNFMMADETPETTK
jgi:hypothetical protein